MRRPLIFTILALAVAAGGFAIAAFAVGESTGTVTAAVPDQVVTIPGTTNVVTYTVPTVTETQTVTVTTSTEPPPPPSAYVYNGFEGAICPAVTTAPFYVQWTYPYQNTCEPAHFLARPGYAGQSAGLAIKSTDGAPNSFGPQTFVGVHPADAHGHDGENTWYGFRFKIPSANYNLVHGCNNWIVEWHEQVSSQNSTGFNLCSWYYDASGNPDRSRVQLLLWLRGGLDSAPASEKWITPLPAGPTITPDVWHSVQIRFAWDNIARNSGGTGEVECYLDGDACPFRFWNASSNGDGPAWVNSQSFPTLHTNTSGTVDTVNYGFYQYAPWPPSSSEVEYDDYAIGPTRASVGG